MWIVNLSVLLLSIRYGVLEAFKRLAVDYYEDLVRWSKIAVDFAASHLGL
jgi:hypothetical protein